MMEKDVSTPSLDYDAMEPYWTQVNAILGGAKTMRKAKQFLPQFPNESDKDYEFRLVNAKFTNVFRDIAENLAAKPFAEELAIKDGTGDTAIEGLIEDIDGQGNHLHVFGAEAFYRGLTHAEHWIFVDAPKTDGNIRSIAEEKAAGIRPYWLHIPATSLLAAETTKIGGKHVWSHVRFRSDTAVREKFEEKLVKRIREYNLEPAGLISYRVWQLYEEGGKKEWRLVEGEGGLLSIDEIPLVGFISGRRIGKRVSEPMLQDAADLQIELFQQENGLKYAKDNTAFPMLAGNGVTPPVGEDGKPAVVPVGPKTVLYAPPNGEGDHGEWTFIEPSAQSLEFLAGDVKETIKQLREIGRQPLTAETGNLTTVMAGQSASKGNSAVSAAALLFKDAIENALRLTAKWMKSDAQPEVEIFTDFDIALSENNGTDALLSARTNGDLSQRTFWDEMSRRGYLGPNFDPDEEEERLNEELPGDDAMDDMVDAGAITAPPQQAAA